MIDFHCHLDLYEDPKAVLETAVKRKCYMLAVTTTPLAWEGTSMLVKGAPRVQVAVGLHPELIASRHYEVGRLCELLPETNYVGEIGLDGSKRYRDSLSLQRQILDVVLGACESVGGRIMSIHSRGATSLILDHLEACRGAGVPVMHWFSGTQTELKRAIELGCWFSVGPAMLKTAKGSRLASSLPIDRVLTESDGPFARRGHAPLMPWDVSEAQSTLAAVWNVAAAVVQTRLLSNLRRLIEAVGDTQALS